MMLVALLTDLYVPLRGVGLRTEQLYRYTIAAFGEHLGHAATVDDLEELVVARFLSSRLREKAVATAAKDRTQLRALWEFAARRGLTESRWPQIRPIRVPERVPRCWLTDEMQRLLVAAGERHGSIAGVPASAWWRAALLLCYDSGERIAPLLSLEWPDVTPAGVTFRAEGRKGQTRDIYRQISPETAAAIEAIRGPRLRVFDWDRAASSLWGHLGKILEAAGLPNDRYSKFHRIRKTTASYAAAAGLDAQRLLDHASPKTTRGYLDPRVVIPPSAPDVLPRVG
jgi:integrase